MDAAAVIPVERLDDTGESEALGRGHGALLGRDDVGPRDRQAGRIEESIGEVLVARDVDADAGGPGGHGGPDTLLVDTLPELDERVAVEADEGDVARSRLVENRLRRRPEGGPFREADETLELRQEVEGRVGRGVHQVVDDPDCQLARLGPDRLLAKLVDDVVLALGPRAAGLAVPDIRAGEVLQLERNVLGNMAGPGAVAEAGQEAAAPVEGAGVILERRHPLDQAVDEAGNRVARELFEAAEVHDHPDDLRTRPVVGTAEDPRLQDLQVGRRLGRAAGRRRGGCARLPVAARLRGCLGHW